ncbi:MAG TPA: translation initiation factor IF-2 N-terminal domain-containing protein, partial [Candidatus Helicobacter avistercoris]|nr:translation initiation factor IF-2 N-terminal domain-containing protein [Candidatus Helicobacter avistercoris]
MSITIKDFALELAMSNPKDALEKAKELGISVKNIGSEISDEDAQKLAEYIESGKLPQKKSTSKAKAPKAEKIEKPQKETKTSRAKNIKTSPVAEAPKVEEGIKEAKKELEEKSNLENKRVGITIVKKSKDALPKDPVVEEVKKQSITPNIKDLFSEKITQEDEELKVKPKKKEKPKVQVSHKQNEQKMDFDREFGSYEDESDEIVLFDLNEQEVKNEDEENRKKQAIVDRVQMQKKNKWMSEGSIRRDKKKRKAPVVNVEKKSAQSAISIPEEIRVYEFADIAGRDLKDVIGALFKLGVMVTKNDFLDRDAIEILA